VTLDGSRFLSPLTWHGSKEFVQSLNPRVLKSLKFLVNRLALMQCGLAIDDDGVRGLVPRGWANRHKAPEIVSNFLRMLHVQFTVRSHQPNGPFVRNCRPFRSEW